MQKAAIQWMPIFCNPLDRALEFSQNISKNDSLFDASKGPLIPPHAFRQGLTCQEIQSPGLWVNFDLSVPFLLVFFREPMPGFDEFLFRQRFNGCLDFINFQHWCVLSITRIPEGRIFFIRPCKAVCCKGRFCNSQNQKDHEQREFQYPISHQ